LGHPNAPVTVPGGPVVGIIDPANKDCPVTPEIVAEVDRQKAAAMTTTPNASVSPYHHRKPFILRAEQLGACLGGDWFQVLENPDRASLGQIQKQPELFSPPAVVRADGTTGRKGRPSTRPHRNQIHQSP
jgi:putative SOS response-associated peptidase YedK